MTRVAKHTVRFQYFYETIDEIRAEKDGEERNESHESERDYLLIISGGVEHHSTVIQQTKDEISSAEDLCIARLHEILAGCLVESAERWNERSIGLEQTVVNESEVEGNEDSHA